MFVDEDAKNLEVIFSDRSFDKSWYQSAVRRSRDDGSTKRISSVRAVRGMIKDKQKEKKTAFVAK